VIEHKRPYPKPIIIADGDYYPESGAGRFVIVVVAIAGACIVGILTSAFMEQLQLSNTETQIEYLLTKAAATSRVKVRAAVVFQRAFHYRRVRRREQQHKTNEQEHELIGQNVLSGSQLPPLTTSKRRHSKVESTEIDRRHFRLLESVQAWRRAANELDYISLNHDSSASGQLMERMLALEKAIESTRTAAPKAPATATDLPVASKLPPAFTATVAQPASVDEKLHQLADGQQRLEAKFDELQEQLQKFCQSTGYN